MAQSTPLDTPVAAPRASGYRWLIIGLFWLRDVLTIIGVSSLPVLLPLIRAEWGLTTLQSGLLAGLSWQVTALFSIPFGAWLPRYSPRRILVGSGLIGALFAGAQALAPSFGALYFFRIGFVLLSPVQTVVGTQVIQQWFQPREIPQVNGRTWGIRSMAQGAAVAIAPFLVILFGTWRGVFAVQSLLLLIWTGVWIVAGRDRATPEYLARLHGGRAKSLRSVFRLPHIRTLAFAQAGCGLAFSAFTTFWPTYAREARAVPLQTVGLIVAMWPIASAVGSFTAPWLVRRLGRRPVLTAAGFGQVVAYLVLLRAESLPLMAAMFFMAGFCTMVPTPVVFSAPYEYGGISPRDVGLIISLINTVTVGTTAIGPVFVGAFAELSGSLPLAMGVAAFACLSMSIAGLIFPEPARLRAAERPA
jgi:MFS family permease